MGRPQSAWHQPNPNLPVWWTLGSHRQVGREWRGQVCMRLEDQTERKTRGIRERKDSHWATNPQSRDGTRSYSHPTICPSFVYAHPPVFHYWRQLVAAMLRM